MFCGCVVLTMLVLCLLIACLVEVVELAAVYFGNCWLFWLVGFGVWRVLVVVGLCSGAYCLVCLLV